MPSWAGPFCWFLAVRRVHFQWHLWLFFTALDRDYLWIIQKTIICTGSPCAPNFESQCYAPKGMVRPPPAKLLLESLEEAQRRFKLYCPQQTRQTAGIGRPKCCAFVSMDRTPSRSSGTGTGLRKCRCLPNSSPWPHVGSPLPHWTRATGSENVRVAWKRTVK